MTDDVKVSSESKWDMLNQMFIIKQLADQAYNEIYEHKTNPWKAFRKIGKRLYQIENHLNVYLLYLELYNELELPEKQIMARHFGQ
ncbi:MAG: hypothetical protein MIO93_00240 [ANME-2 cluster archaeon]|nr:hypothetical protein [ANME-2 cluster archaeon]